ncbi:MAG: carboxypeptidase-like regulatory domain-containing protein [Candidatus Kapaibacterium sp.]
MAVTRKLPHSDFSRNIALKIAYIKKGLVAPADLAITPQTITKLNATQPLFSNRMNNRASALEAQSSATVLKTTAQEKTKTIISHFIQVFNLGVEREDYPKSARAFYKLDVNSNSVPPLIKESDIIYWGEQLITGEAARIADGGEKMTNPTIEVVISKYEDFMTQNNIQSTMKDAYDTAQEQVSSMRPDVDGLILKIWDEVETFYNQDPPPSKRRYAREWGVAYVSTQKATITGTVTKAADDTPLAGVNVALIESEDIVKTDSDGKYKLTTVFTGEGTLEFSLEGYATQIFPVEIPEGGSLVKDVVMATV